MKPASTVGDVRFRTVAGGPVAYGFWQENRVQIADLITRSLVTVGPEAWISEAARQMAEANVGSVVVMDGEEPIGIVTDRDLTLLQQNGVEDRRIEEVMTTSPLAVRAGTDIEQCIGRMSEHRVRRTIVIDEDGKPLGVVSLDDIVIHLSNTLDKVASLMRAQIVGA